MTFKSRAGTFAGFVTDDRVYLQITVQCTPPGVEKFIKFFEAGIPHRRELHPKLTPIGAWRTIYGPYDEITHLYEFDSIAEMEKIRKGLNADPQHLQRTSLSASAEPPSSWQHNRGSKVMKLTPYSPRELVNVAGPGSPGAVATAKPSDDRVYLYCNVVGTRAIGEFIEHYGAGVENRRRLDPSLVPVAAWRTIYGGSTYEVTHLFAFDSLAEMARARKLLHSDPKQVEHMSKNTSPNPPNNWETDERNKLLKPLPYSQMK